MEDCGVVEISKRSVTDKDCLCLFLTCVVLMWSSGIKGFVQGDIQKLFAPLDAADNFCGQDLFKEHPFLYVPLKGVDFVGMFYTGVCVKECPAKDGETKCMVNAKVEKCPTAGYDTTNKFGYCIPPSISALPKSTQDSLKEMQKGLISDSGNKYFEDIMTSQNSILISILSAFIVTLIYIGLMSTKWFNSCVLWLSVFLIQIGLFL